MYTQVKQIFKNIIVVYLAFFMLLASLAIPYSAMTCKVSNTTSFTFLNGTFSCEKEEASNSCKDSFEFSSVEKADCCLYDSDVIEADAELILSQTIGFQSHIAFLELPKIPIAQILGFAFIFPTQREVDIPEPPVRILQQSFLC